MLANSVTKLMIRSKTYYIKSLKIALRTLVSISPINISNPLTLIKWKKADRPAPSMPAHLSLLKMGRGELSQNRWSSPKSHPTLFSGGLTSWCARQIKTFINAFFYSLIVAKRELCCFCHKKYKNKRQINLW